MTPGIRCCIERRRQPTKATGQLARQIMDAVSYNYATTRRDRYICLTPKSNTEGIEINEQLSLRNSLNALCYQSSSIGACVCLRSAHTPEIQRRHKQQITELFIKLFLIR